MTTARDAATQVRRAVRAATRSQDRLLVACSGGPDSLALAVAAGLERPGDVTAVIVDHGLQRDSDQVAATAAATLAEHGVPAEVQRVVVTESGTGPEAAARAARYAALVDAGRAQGACVLLGHTQDDQAETVLLGLARGSGARSLAGMAAAFTRGGVPFLRPLLDLPRATTLAACAHWRLQAWEDPHNRDPRYLRARLRGDVMPRLQATFGPGVAAALARTADLLRDDDEALSAAADQGLEQARRFDPERRSDVLLDLEALARLPRAVRTRVLRRAAIAAGSPPGALNYEHVSCLESLVSDWSGQGPTALPGPVSGSREYGRLRLAGPTDES
jgi:tRNA(Ile)-lysidine synthetase-like protein